MVTITRIQVYGRTRSVRSRTRSIGFEAELDPGDNLEAETMILQDRVDRQLAEWTRALDEIDAQAAREEHERQLLDPSPF
jgi:hypothetical protein